MSVRVDAVRGQVPLCVSAYDNILDYVTAAGLGAGDQIPGEIQLADQLAVSRSVVREALLLLEEDGYLVRHRGKPRTLAQRDHRRVGFDSPITAQLVGEVAPARRLSAMIYHAFPPVREDFGVAGDGLMWETSYTVNGREVCSSLEWTPVDLAPAWLRESVRDGAPFAAYPATMLEAIQADRSRALNLLQWRLNPISVASQRAGCLDFASGAVPVGLTIALGTMAELTYYAKHVFDLAVASMVIEPTGFPTTSAGTTP